MAEKIVDVFEKDKLLESYTVIWNVLNAPASVQDFVRLAKDCMRDDGYTAARIAAATFKVKDP